MNLLITTPSLKVPHGGTRILNEWAARLSKWHEVTLLVNKGETTCDWYELSPKIRVTSDDSALGSADCVIIGSPHAVNLQSRVRSGAKCFLFLQMLEHLFNPNNKYFKQLCFQLYKSPNPMFSISKWNIKFLQKNMQRRGEIFYIGNGVNFEHFPLELKKKDDIVLVEGWESNNTTKDISAIGPKVAKRLKNEGYKILAYSQYPLKRYSEVPNEYYQCPSQEKLNELYSRAKILIKATRFDARSTAPMEAMTKGTPTVRAIIDGDDDLIHDFNAWRVPYKEQSLYTGALDVLSNEELYSKLSKNCFEYVQKYDWDYWMEQINEIICTKG